MLDVISGAMGAFLIIMVILLPFYKKDAVDFEKEARALRVALETN